MRLWLGKRFAVTAAVNGPDLQELKGFVLICYTREREREGEAGREREREREMDR